MSNFIIIDIFLFDFHIIIVKLFFHLLIDIIKSAHSPFLMIIIVINLR